MATGSNEAEQRIKAYFRKINAINFVSSMVALFPTIIAIFAEVPFWYFFPLVATQVLLLSLLSYYKYYIDKKARNIEINPGRYVLENTMSYAVFSFALPILFFLLRLFYSLSSLQRVFVINVLFVLILLFILSNLPASRLVKISTPLDDHYLVEKANELSKKLSTGPLGLYVMKLGRFRIANAGQVGTRKYSVFITDYLLENLSPEENVAVIAHEFAHAKEKHVLKTATIAWSISAICANLMVYPVDVGTYPLLALTLPLGGFIFLFISIFLIIPAIQRRFEAKADLIAASVVNGMDLVNALQKISRLNFTPSDISRHWSLDHPPTRERVIKIISYTRTRKPQNQ